MIPDDSSSCVMNFGAPGVKSAGSNVATSVSASLPMSYFQIRASTPGSRILLQQHVAARVDGDVVEHVEPLERPTGLGAVEQLVDRAAEAGLETSVKRSR